ncbi:MAG: peroxiredoxin family protein [Verrucomicrobiales bacterium]
MCPPVTTLYRLFRDQLPVGKAAASSTPAVGPGDNETVREIGVNLRILAALVFVTLQSPMAAALPARPGATPPEWQLSGWINSRPLKLADLRGQAVLVRWFTSQECPHCSATAPALNEFHSQFGTRGLQVIGAYHHKSDSPFDRSTVQKIAGAYGFKFPVAIDDDWKTLRSWWLDHKTDSASTSVTFLLDQKGVIQHIHPGGRYVKGDKDYAAMIAKIHELLKSSSTTPRRSS